MNKSVAAKNPRADLLDAAQRLLLARSYGSVGVAEICAEAGVRKGSLYYFFPGKEALVQAMLARLYASFEQEVLVPSLSTPGTLAQRLDALVEHLYAFQADRLHQYGVLPGCPFGNLAVEMATGNGAMRCAVAEHLSGLQTHFRLALEAARKRGELAPDVEPDMLAQQWLALMEGILVLAKSEQDPEVIRRLAPALYALLLGKHDHRSGYDTSPRTEESRYE